MYLHKRRREVFRNFPKETCRTAQGLERKEPSTSYLAFCNEMKRKIKDLKTFFLQLSQQVQLCLLFTLVLSLSFSSSVSSQIYSSHEENFAYEVKQIDEFIERFNDEGTLIKYYIFKNYDGLQVSREDLLKSLFNLKSKHLNKEDVIRFINHVNDPRQPVTLSFYDKGWYAKVKCSVTYEKKERELVLLMRIQQEEDGASKWVVQQVYADFLNTPDGKDPRAFLNPVSHATDFMGLNRAFNDPENLKGYLTSSFQDDQLSKFAMEMQKNRISFQQVEHISYHFFQVDGWIFTVENFQRQEKNAGWLISRLVPANAEEKKEYMETLLKENT